MQISFPGLPLSDSTNPDVFDSFIEIFIPRNDAGDLPFLRRVLGHPFTPLPRPLFLLGFDQFVDDSVLVLEFDGLAILAGLEADSKSVPKSSPCCNRLRRFEPWPTRLWEGRR